ncbi:MAG: hypothetical protein HUJ68_12120 [Clostridia bacterium]|nr:hypothetical protein [Clostridia bacterium]
MTTFPYVKSSVKKYNVARNAFLPRFVTVPMEQEHGVLCKRVVEIGNIVNEGQVIAVPSGSDECKIHSPVPGKVIDIFTDVSSNGRPCLMVKIGLEGSFNYTGKKPCEVDWKNISPEEITDKMSENGVINTFDSSFSVSLCKEIKALKKAGEDYSHSLIVRLFDEDPVRLTDTFIFGKYFSEIRKASKITAKAGNLKTIVYMIDESFRNNTFELSPDEKIFFVNSKKYPSGFKKELCYAFNKNASKSGGIKISEKDLFVDSTTMYEVYKAVALNIPSLDHFVQFTGNCISVNCVLNVRLGTTLDEIVKQIGGFDKKPNFIIVNGHVTGNSVSWRNFPITKEVKSITFVSRTKTPEQLVCGCISCGNCREICPRNLSPDLLYKNKCEHFPLPLKYVESVRSCSECGLCNSVCPSRIALTQIISVMKEDLDANNREVDL